MAIAMAKEMARKIVIIPDRPRQSGIFPKTRKPEPEMHMDKERQGLAKMREDLGRSIEQLKREIAEAEECLGRTSVADIAATTRMRESSSTILRTDTPSIMSFLGSGKEKK